MNKVEFVDTMKIKEMEEGRIYSITQGGNGFSDGVFVKKDGDSLRLRHVWIDESEALQNNNYYKKEGNVFVPRDPESDVTFVIHKDIMQIIPDAITYTFEEMKLDEFYGIVHMGMYYNEWENGFKLPRHLKGKYRIIDANGKCISE